MRQRADHGLHLERNRALDTGGTQLVRMGGSQSLDQLDVRSIAEMSMSRSIRRYCPSVEPALLGS